MIETAGVSNEITVLLPAIERQIGAGYYSIVSLLKNGDVFKAHRSERISA